MPRNQPRSSRGRSAIARKVMNTNSTNGMMYQGTCIAHDGTKITPCRNFGGMKKGGAHPSATGFMRSRPWQMSVPAKHKNVMFRMNTSKSAEERVLDEEPDAPVEEPDAACSAATQISSCGKRWALSDPGCATFNATYNTVDYRCATPSMGNFYCAPGEACAPTPPPTPLEKCIGDNSCNYMGKAGCIITTNVEQEFCCKNDSNSYDGIGCVNSKNVCAVNKSTSETAKLCGRDVSGCEVQCVVGEHYHSGHPLADPLGCMKDEDMHVADTGPTYPTITTPRASSSPAPRV
jgi:hypothetical protein